MPEKTAAQKKAQKRYMEKFVVAQVRMDRGKYETVQAHAASCGQSVNAYINAAIAEKMGGPSTSPAGVPTAPRTGADGILTRSTVKAAQEAAQAAGEAVPQFIERAVEEQAQRDALAREMEGKP